MSTTSRERNALLGLLAVRSGLIERRQLADAMTAWENDPSQPLERLLVNRQVLGEMHCRLLEELVAEKTRRHRLDVPACLREICAEAPELAEIGRELVPGLSGDAPVSPEIAPTLDAMSLPLARAGGAAQTEDGGREARAGGRFRILERHAEGGLGRVMRARDEELGRTVAVKEIKPEQAGNPVSQERFVLEAEITGGLEHPGIVPVYSLGRYDDGRPYYAMRFIRGENLNQAIAGFHQRDSLPRDDGQRLLELHQLLRRFIDTCNAVRYAHSRGVLHRDIKPANVMLGRFGETLVVDWGWPS